MASTWRSLFLRVVMSTCLMAVLSSASPCAGSQERLTVDFTVRRVFSPGYPDNYENNLRCDWVFVADVKQELGFGIQLTTLDLHLDAPYSLKTGECKDSLEVFEGQTPNLGQSLSKWCGRTKHIIKTMLTTVTLRFLSDEYFVGRGFVIEYSLVRVASAECQPGKVTPVHVGRTPLYESFDVKNAGERCTWTMEAIDELGNSDSKSALVIEAFNVPYVLCEVGHFILYDGPYTNSREVLRWCGPGQAFSKIYLSSNYATLTFVFKMASVLDTIQLKLYTRNVTYACNDKHLPAINVGVDPVYFYLPFSRSTSGAECSVHVSQNVKNSVRVEVLSVGEKEATCETDVVSVKQVTKNKEVPKTCNRQKYPMYIPATHQLTVATKNTGNIVYLRAVSDDVYCGGVEIRGAAFDGMIMDQMLPNEKILTSVPHNCYLRYLITTKNENRTIALKVQWSPNVFQKNMFTESDACQGDFISIYDGINETASLLLSSCRKSDMPHNYVLADILGTRQEMLIVFNTDGAHEAKQAHLSYFAVPANVEQCPHESKIFVNGSIQYITSPNYPEFYPMDYSCLYTLVADEKDVLVVEPVDTSFMSGCGDVLSLYEGTLIHEANIVGRICGQDRTYNNRFIIKFHKALIRFTSDRFGSIGGWKLRVYSQSGGGKTGTSLAIVSLIIFLVVVALIM